MAPRLLRILLLFSALGWGISAVAIFAPWSIAVRLLESLGARGIPADPMLDYWLRMAGGAFTGIGIFFLMLALFPKRYASIIPVAGLLMLGEGVVLLVHGVRLGLPPVPFWYDTLFCLGLGTGILVLSAQGRGNKHALARKEN